MNENSLKIDSLEPVMLGGDKQWIYITGENINNPILLIIHGGPGFAMLPLFHENNSPLEEKYTLVNWDQRGAGRSYSPDSKSITVEQIISDAHELTLNLLSRFNQKKIFLLGHSTGTIIGVLLAKRHPENYYAYIGVGQVVNFSENERLGYDFALRQAIKKNHKKAIKELKKIGPPDEDGDYEDDSGYEVTSKWLEFFGGELYKHKNIDTIYDEIFDHAVYKQSQKELLAGYEISQSLFENGIRDFEAESDASTLTIPVYLFSGKYDYDTPSKLVKRYYRYLKAPTKVFIKFKHSAHFPFYEEPERFNQKMIDLVLPNAHQ